MFQLTPPHGGRQSWARRPGCLGSFNSRPRMGGDPQSVEFRRRGRVSTHAPAWGATRRPRRGRRRRCCFNSRPRMGGDDNDLILTIIESVSTHAPAWGATHGCEVPFTLPEVSTHAPAWGATFIRKIWLKGKGFQLTPPHGGRPSDFPYICGAIAFQLTPPHGGRHGHFSRCRYFSSFQLTPPHGGRHHTDPDAVSHAVSTHAPACGFVNANLITRDSRILTTPVILPRPPF